MRIPRIYTSIHLSPQRRVVLQDGSAHYMKNVLRMKSGRQLILFNGDGCDYSATVVALDKKSVTVDIADDTVVENESPLVSHLGFCLIKNERMDWLLQKATELGVTHFYPLVSEFTDVKIPADRLAKKLSHWQQVIISACEQCGRSRIPTLVEPRSLPSWMDDLASDSIRVDLKVVLHPHKAQAFRSFPPAQSLALLVGPEGGLSDEEIEAALRYDFQTMSLGSRILRAETAPLAALSLFQSSCGDW